MKRAILFSLSFLLVLLFSLKAWSQDIEDYYKQGVERYNVSDFRGALEAWEKGLKLAERTNNKQVIGTFLSNIGIVYYYLDDYPKALSCYEKSLKISRELGDSKGEGNDLTNIGIVYRDLGDYSMALSYHQHALKIHREFGDDRVESDDLNSIGIVYYRLGDYSKALSYYEQALEIRKKIGYRLGHTLSNIGIVYRDLGDHPKALSYYEKSLKISRETGDRLSERDVLNNIGFVYWSLGDYPKALSYYEKALKIDKEIGVPTDVQEANIGDVYLEQERFDDAFKIFNKLNWSLHLGRYYLKIGEHDKAREEFSRSLKEDEAKEMPNADFLLAKYIGLGLSYEGLRDYQKAKPYYKKGIDLIESQRGRLGGEKERFFEAKVMGFSRLEPYEGMVRVLIKEKDKGYEREALSYTERARSKTFLEMLANQRPKGITKEDKAIIEKERVYQQDILVQRKRMEVLERLGDKAPKGELQKLKDELGQKEAEYERFIKEVKLKNLELASLISVNPTPIEKIQSLLDKDTTLLEYYSTKDSLYAWLITKDDIKVYEMPFKEKDLKDKLDKFLLPNISNRSRKAEPVMTLAVGDEYKKETTEKERAENRRRFSSEADEFYKLIFAPVERDIKTEKLIIVPHGALHKAPFATLTDGKKYLIEKYSISMLPSASVLEYVVKKRKTSKDSILAFGNPIADYVPGFSELTNAETEVERISNGFNKKEIYKRREATEARAKQRATDPNVIHIASHGEFNDLQPMQSGLLLAKDKDNDGFLQVHEIFGIDLRNANLVTLSACETGLSKIHGGDDLVGLSRGFIYAGTPSILATLWKVNDKSTSIIMENFYENWNKGMSKPEALRQAQLKWIREHKDDVELSHPYYWAPFVMIGDWR